MDKQETLKVVGCGLPRTGTMSLQHALQILYKGPCMHGFTWPLKGKEVNHLLDNIDDDQIFKDYFKKYGFIASTDVPFSCYYEKFMKLYPDVKFVLTTRNPENWAKSIKASVAQLAGWHSIFLKFPCNFFLNTCLFVIDNSFYRWQVYTRKFKMLVDITNTVEESNGIEYYEKWIDEVKSTIPKERLLIFHVGEGWEPLCDFLELPVPNVPFPNANDRMEMKRIINSFKFLSWTWLAAVVLSPVIGGYYVAKYYKNW